jgi:hypothetical protein
LANVIDAGRDAVDAEGAARRAALEADGKVVWSWHLDAGVKLAVATLLATVTNKPDHRGEHGAAVKTIARGMPGCSGEPVVTTLVWLFHFPREAAGASSARLPCAL